MSKEELRISNQNHHRPPKKRVSTQAVPPIEHSETKSSPTDEEKLIQTCINLHRTTFNEKFSQETQVNRSAMH